MTKTIILNRLCHNETTRGGGKMCVCSECTRKRAPKIKSKTRPGDNFKKRYVAYRDIDPEVKLRSNLDQFDMGMDYCNIDRCGAHALALASKRRRR